MQALISVVIFAAWSCLGAAVLGRVTALDRTAKVLLSPAVGIAVATIVIATASFAGLSISTSAWLVVAAVPVAAYVVARRGFHAAGDTGSLYGLIVVANVMTAGLGVVLFGSAWQGFVNGDAATNSLAAQYFIAHPFFSEPSLADAIRGTDYSDFAFLLNVAGGQRFGDVMLLALSARVFHLTPDQVYMAHGLALRYAMIAACALLVHAPGSTSRRRTIFVLLALSLSPLLTYAFVNQLISQVDGMTLCFALIAVCDRYLRTPQDFRSLLLPAALLAAALCETYPESVPYFGLSFIVLVVHYGLFAKLPSWRSLALFALALGISVLILLNVSLPSTVYAVTNILTWGGVSQRFLEVNIDFPYAFIPDFFPLLLGFEGLRESLHEPIATLTIVAGAIGLISILWFTARQHRRFPALFACMLAAWVVFALFFMRNNGFGAFKLMILMQPVLYCAAADMLASAYARRAIGYLTAGLAAVVAASRGDAAYIFRSLSPFGEITHIADSNVLGQIDSLRARSPLGMVLDPSNYLLRRFAMLRPGARPLKTSESFYAYAGTQAFLNLVALNPFSRWLPQMPGLVDRVLAYYEQEYELRKFACAAPKDEVVFEALRDRTAMGTLISGPRSVPLNALGGIPDAVIEGIDAFTAGAALVFRASSMGSFYGAKSAGYSGAVSLYATERDFALPSIIAATGRYAMFELLAPPPGPIRVSLSYSRSPLGGADSTLMPVTVYGAERVRIETAGSGAFSETSPPFTPCVVAGRSYFIVDFGTEPEHFKKDVPMFYRLLNTPYLPDARKVSGFLRDLSVVRDIGAGEALDEGADSVATWTFAEFTARFEFSGIFEDGWMSDRLMLKARDGRRGRMTIEFDVPMEVAANHPVVSASVDGTVIARQALSAGTNHLSIDLPADTHSPLELAVDKPFRLPGADGRPAFGHVRSISVQ